MKKTKILKTVKADNRSAVGLKALLLCNPMNSLQLLPYLSPATLAAALWDVQAARRRLRLARTRVPAERDLIAIEREISELLREPRG